MLVVQDWIVTVDALGCQKKMAQALRDAKADYVRRVKAKQGHLYQDLEDWFAYAQQTGFAPLTHSHEGVVGQDHGRRENRECWVVSAPVACEYIRPYEGGPDLHSIAKVGRRRLLNGTLTTETAYYLSSLDPDAQLLLACSRSHWAVENALPWVLAVAFREDEARYRQGNGPPTRS
jgi:predicted transposase YbfD/YdcC